jgi:hypothetical protein
MFWRKEKFLGGSFLWLHSGSLACENVVAIFVLVVALHCGLLIYSWNVTRYLVFHAPVPPVQLLGI